MSKMEISIVNDNAYNPIMLDDIKGYELEVVVDYKTETIIVTKDSTEYMDFVSNSSYVRHNGFPDIDIIDVTQLDESLINKLDSLDYESYFESNNCLYKAKSISDIIIFIWEY